ncbi:MAG: decarboxylase, partial [Lachnospiraceae bacterium]|nr:decarboxylase [Lachnospiraceae bacterium]
MYGARDTLFSVNGSTCALLAAISAAVPKGGTVLIERRSHMAVYHAAYLRELDVAYVEDAGFDAEDIDAGKSIDAVVITSPTYEGCMKDVSGWAEYAHANGAVLIVDEAHGAHLGFHPYFPESAARCGADLVVQSTHKTLPAMTQTALLHNVTGRVPTGKLHFFMDIYETSSPSYVLMASITSSLRLVRERGDEFFAAYAERLRKVRRELCSLKHFRLAGGEDAVLGFDNELPPHKAGTVMDPGKLVLVPRHFRKISERYGAAWLYDELRDGYHLQMEMRTDTYCLAMTSIADSDEGFGRLVAAMREIDERVENDSQRRDCGKQKDIGHREEIVKVSVVRTEKEGCMKIFAALDAPSETINLADAAGRICADFVILYPPDVPLIVPGEVYTEEKADEILGWIERGFSVMGAG